MKLLTFNLEFLFKLQIYTVIINNKLQKISDNFVFYTLYGNCKHIYICFLIADRLFWISWNYLHDAYVRLHENSKNTQ